MRWDRLFDDLEGHFEHELDAAEQAEVADRIRAQRSRLSLAGRLREHRGPIRVLLRHGRLVIGELVDAGADWCEIEGDPRGRTVVPVEGIVEVDGLRPVDTPGDDAPEPGMATGLGVGGIPGGVASRLRLGHPLRRLARDREVVEIVDALGRELVGTIDAVGADAFDLALHPRELPRRRANLTGRPTVPFSAVVCVTAVGLA